MVGPTRENHPSIFPDLPSLFVRTFCWKAKHIVRKIIAPGPGKDCYTARQIDFHCQDSLLLCPSPTPLWCGGSAGFLGLFVPRLLQMASESPSRPRLSSTRCGTMSLLGLSLLLLMCKKRVRASKKYTLPIPIEARRNISAYPYGLEGSHMYVYIYTYLPGCPHPGVKASRYRWI